MRRIAVPVLCVLLAGCSTIKHVFAPAPVAITGPADTPVPTPRPAVPPKPKTHIPPPPPLRAAIPPSTTTTTTTPAATPAPVAAAPVQQAAAPEPAPDYTQRCTALAESRADDAKQLGASKADQQKMQADVYENCLKQSVKPGYPP
ncbi:MAG TPA: hypothetical protein VGU69_08845 [Rhizomicrobium sp.]|nr:hypothetical protein [Rhizomicrobium sp.]